MSAQPSATNTRPCHLCEGTGKADWPEYFGEDPRDVPPCLECDGTGRAIAQRGGEDYPERAYGVQYTRP